MNVNSRQDDYRIRMLRMGRCIHCGNHPLVTATMCEECRRKCKLKAAKWRLKKQEERLKKELDKRSGK